MKRVYLFCSAGMSTSMLASKMQNVADEHNLPIEVEAFPDGKIGQIIDEKQPDVILLGPQVKYRYGEIVEKYGSRGIPIQVIDQTDYGMMNGEKVLKSAIKLLKASK
ncbi:PTS sugar transporter subunit IIB [Lacrimispora indolis]|uniref:PTS sugar transporter subunit IIB n=1 Tax=Lacrimispora indolis TaxID=69825 RepID=UPI00041C7B51|nr:MULTISPECIES: PTS sugar transporter subunit IIB [Lachnospiraceae]